MSKRDLAIDLGTANTLVFQQGHGVVYAEPTMVAMNARSGEVLAVGGDAWNLVGRAPQTVVPAWPIIRGAITDFDMTQQMIRLILRKVGVGRFPKPRVLVCVPSLSTEVERRAVEEAVTTAGARSVALLEEPLAAAIGAGLPITEPFGNLVVDVGGGTTDIAVLAMGGVVTGKAIRVGGFDMDAAVRRMIRERHGVAIGDTAGERIKIRLGSAYPAADARPAQIRGRDMSTGMPKVVTVGPDEVREALGETIRSIVQTTRECLAEAPPELAHDVLETGAFLTGGGGLLRGLGMRLAQECEVPVHLTEYPLTTVVTGAGRLLDYLPDYRSAFIGTRAGA
jgi:rod shape-determining protein MreB